MTDEPDSTIEIQMSDSQLDFFVRNQVAVHVVQHWDTSEPHRTAGMLVVSRRLLEDPGFDLAAWAVLATERVRRPWRYPDPPAIPKIEPFPRLSRFLRRGRAARRGSTSLLRWWLRGNRKDHHAPPVVRVAREHPDVTKRGWRELASFTALVILGVVLLFVLTLIASYAVRLS